MSFESDGCNPLQAILLFLNSEKLKSAFRADDSMERVNFGTKILPQQLSYP
jgi:hypothetical protein